MLINAVDPGAIAPERKYKPSLMTSADNIGVVPAIAKLAKAATKPGFMFLKTIGSGIIALAVGPDLFQRDGSPSRPTPQRSASRHRRHK